MTRARDFRNSSVLFAALMTACGDSNDSNGGTSDSTGGTFDESTTCGLAVTLSGDADFHSTTRTSVGCGIQHSLGSGVDVVFLPIEADLRGISLSIEDVMVGQTGEDFPASLDVSHKDGRRWQVDSCSVDITRHEYIEPAELNRKAYQVTGTGTCTAPATDDESSLLEIGDFVFTVRVTWAE